MAAELVLEDFGGRSIAESFTGTFVESLFHAGRPAVTDPREIGALGKKLPQPSGGVFVRAALQEA